MEKSTPSRKPRAPATPAAKPLSAPPAAPSSPAAPLAAPQVVVQAWTDGACSGNPGPGGWGAIARVNGREMTFFGGANPSTNNIMELFGVIFLLEALRGKLPAGALLQIHTDSQYTQKGAMEWLPGWKKRGWKKPDGKPVANADFWRRFDAAREALAGVKVVLLWTRGHAGDPLNERADALARRGAKASAALPKGGWLDPARAS